jgi:DNA polymerase III subunit epsilon
MRYPSVTTREDRAMEISGTPAQVRYAEGVRSQLARRFDVYDLPDVSIPQFWIDSKDVRSIDELEERAKPYIGVINTPFTSTFPRYNRQDAINAIKALGDDYAILDIETTGLKRNVDEIIEIAIVHADGTVLLDTLVRPMDIDHLIKSIDKGISKIMLEELEAAQMFQDLAQDIAAILEKHHILIYNASFDAPFLAYQYLKSGLSIPTIHATCAMRIASAYFNIDTYLSLETVCKMLNIGQVEPVHRALSDCRTTRGVMQAMEPKPVINNRLIQLRAKLQESRSK